MLSASITISPGPAVFDSSLPESDIYILFYWNSEFSINLNIHDLFWLENVGLANVLWSLARSNFWETYLANLSLRHLLGNFVLEKSVSLLPSNILKSIFICSLLRNIIIWHQLEATVSKQDLLCSVASRWIFELVDDQRVAHCQLLNMLLVAKRDSDCLRLILQLH